MTTQTTPDSDTRITISRYFDAPRELVWKCFVEPEHVAAWFGPRGFTTRVNKLDLRVGGKTDYVMVGPDGQEYPCGGTFKEIVPFEKYVSTDEFGEDFVPPPGVELPQGIIATLLFTDEGKGTRLTVLLDHPDARAKKLHEEMGVVGGWGTSFDCLDDHLAAVQGKAGAADVEIVTTRVFDAPADLLFDAFTDVKHVSNWWGPLGFTTTTKSHDLREGGLWTFTMHGPDGTDYQNRVEYTEINRPHKLSYRYGGEEAHEHIQFVNTITFDPQKDGKTKLTMRAIFPTQDERDRVEREAGAAVGGLDTLARFAASVAERNGKVDHDVLSISLPSAREVVMRRVISAPLDLVYDCFTNAEHLKNWWGCRAFTSVTFELDFRVGGKWRIVQRDPQGNEFPFCGEIRAIEPKKRIQQTFTYDVEPFRDYPSIETMNFHDLGDKTMLIAHIDYPSQAARDGHMGSGMEMGAAESYSRLEELVQKLQK